MLHQPETTLPRPGGPTWGERHVCRSIWGPLRGSGDFRLLFASHPITLLGAPLGGVPAAELGPWVVYALDAASFTVSAACLLRISPSVTQTTQGASSDRSGLASIGEGLRPRRSNR